MDWKYKRFADVRTYPQPRDQVLAESLRVMAGTSKWTAETTADGFNVNGIDFGHPATAAFQVISTDGGARVTVKLAVRRWGPEGYMLLDVGGYYQGELRKWLDAIGDHLEGRVADAAPRRPQNIGARVFGWTVLVGVAGGLLIFGWTFIVGPIVGLTTGVLFLPGRNGDDVLHGIWARGVSAAILALDGVFYLNWRNWNRRRPQLSPE